MTIRMLIALLILVSSSAHADRKDMVKKYLEEHKAAVKKDVYSTPQIYEGSVKRSDKDQVVEKRAKRSIGHFGYDLFREPSSDFYVPSEAPVPEDYVLGPGDNVIVNLWGRVEKTYNLLIDREGKVFIPKAGELTLWGLTLRDAEEKLADFLSQIYSDFNLSVVLGKIKSIKVYVYGEVKKPGAYTVSSLSTLFNVLYLAGGPNGKGSLRKISLFRNGSKVSEIDLYDLLLHGKNLDMRLANNDVIFVPVIGNTASISGFVKRPAIYELLGGERVTDLIDLAGGLKPDAYLERVMVERIEDNNSRIVIDLNLMGEAKRHNNIPIQDGDNIEIFSVYDFKENIVELKGRVKYPGKYEYKRGMRISDLIDDGNQILLDSYLDRANLIRTYKDLTKRIFSIDLNAVLTGDTLADVELEKRDCLVVFDRDDIRRIPYVSIEGEVRKEGAYELTKDMRLSDLLFFAGGLKKSAFLLYADIARVDSGRPSKIIRTNLKSCLDNPGGQDDLLLREDDKVFIREIPEWRLHELVALEGEFKFPGRYALVKEHEMLSELVERAGGFTDRAFLRGAVFERASIAGDIKRQRLIDILSNLQEVTTDTLEIILRQQQLSSLEPEKMKRIVVDLVRLFEKEDPTQDIELRGGDRIYIPKIPSGVHVLGAVASSGTIKYVPLENYKFYIRHAGGLMKSADKGEIRIVKPDGKVFKRNLSRLKIELGDCIVVPKRLVKERDWLKILTSSFSILGSVVTTAYLIAKL